MSKRKTLTYTNASFIVVDFIFVFHEQINCILCIILAAVTCRQKILQLFICNS